MHGVTMKFNGGCFLVKSVQAKINSYRITASSKADGGRISVGYHQTISGRGIGR